MIHPDAGVVGAEGDDVALVRGSTFSVSLHHGLPVTGFPVAAEDEHVVTVQVHRVDGVRSRSRS